MTQVAFARGLALTLVTATAGLAQQAITHPEVLMTPSERLKYFVNSNVGADALGKRAFISGVQHLRDSPYEWDQGFEGLGRRVAFRVVRAGISNSVELAGGFLWGENPRYVRLGEGGFWRRTGHAVRETYVTRYADGSMQLRYGGIAGTVVGNLSTMWMLPERQQSVGFAMRRSGLNLASNIGWSVLKEFLPDIKKKLLKK